MTSTTIRPAWAAFYFEPHEGLADDAIVPTFCSRCGGSGLPLGASDYLPAGGACFGECGGVRGPIGSETVADARAREKRRAQRLAREEKARLKKVAERDAIVAAIEASHPAEWAWIVEHEERSSFARSLYAQAALFEGGKLPRTLSERQLAAVTRIVAQDAEKAAKVAALGTLEPGRRELVGVIVSTKEEDDPFSPYGGSTWKMLVELESGHRVYGTLGRSVEDAMIEAGLNGVLEPGEGYFDRLKGKRLAFTGTVKPSDRDASFGFFSRPTKARFLEA